MIRSFGAPIKDFFMEMWPRKGIDGGRVTRGVENRRHLPLSMDVFAFLRENYLQRKSPRIQSSMMNLTAVSGRLMTQKRKSERASEMTKMVVACWRNFAQRQRAHTVNKFPARGVIVISCSSRRPKCH